MYQLQEHFNVQSDFNKDRKLANWLLQCLQGKKPKTKYINQKENDE